ncbi:free fatty acid receptor 3-like [Triplophysa rosa]|uniref:Free fatty acid receptor 3-like n=1 Tax=Triplophysa rosa TaxID=992332 RepID=A0A9W7WPY0_TRIRA|nr:free fatty acid receptor 3-like [Triplophysa rosa]KAI7806184.1 putative free fatty acid receptor 3-like [Triplophysa rosa]
MVWTVNLSKLVLAVDGFTLITGVPANILAFYTFCKKIRQRSTPTDVLLLSLTISDLVFLFFLPFRMVEAANMKWTLPYFLCPLSGLIFYATICNSTFHLTAISVERYLGVAFPIKYKLKRAPRYAVIAVVFFWLVSMAQCSIVYVMQYHHHSNPNFTEPSKRNSCYDEFSEEQLKILVPVRLQLFVVYFCIPIPICCFCYFRCIYILTNLPNVNSKKRMRSIGMALGTLLVFIGCFMPFSVSHLEGFIGGYSTEWRPYALLTCTLNACFDPFIFYFSSSAFRDTFKSVLRELVRRMHLHCCYSTFSCLLQKGGAAEQRIHRANDISSQ